MSGSKSTPNTVASAKPSIKDAQTLIKMAEIDKAATKALEAFEKQFGQIFGSGKKCGK